jgi:hypothetical protein
VGSRRQVAESRRQRKRAESREAGSRRHRAEAESRRQKGERNPEGREESIAGERTWSGQMRAKKGTGERGGQTLLAIGKFSD